MNKVLSLQNKRGMKCAALAISVASCLVAQSNMLIEINDPRALAQAALRLESRLGVPINYEDGPYLFGGDVVDVAPDIMSAEQKAAHPAAHVWVPRGGRLSVSMPLSPTGNVAVSSVPSLVNWLITASRNQGLPGSHAMLVENGTVTIVPLTARDESGASVSVTPLLGTKVSLPYAELNAGDALQSILSQVSKATGVAVYVGDVPINAMINSRVPIGAAEESARVVISRLLSSIGTITTSNGENVPALAYHLYFDPGQKAYYFNVHVLTTSSMNKSVLSPVNSIQVLGANPGGGDAYNRRDALKTK